MPLLKNIFSSTLGIDISSVSETIDMQSTPSWDSLSHMSLITAIESEYNISLDGDDIVEMQSYASIVKVLSRFGINV